MGIFIVVVAVAVPTAARGTADACLNAHCALPRRHRARQQLREDANFRRHHHLSDRERVVQSLLCETVSQHDARRFSNDILQQSDDSRACLAEGNTGDHTDLVLSEKNVFNYEFVLSLAIQQSEKPDSYRATVSSAESRGAPQ